MAKARKQAQRKLTNLKTRTLDHGKTSRRSAEAVRGGTVPKGREPLKTCYDAFITIEG